MHATRCHLTSHHITSHFVALALGTDSCNNVPHSKWYYDENRIHHMQALLKHKQEVCIWTKMLLTILKHLTLFQRYLSFVKWANLPSDDVIHSIIFWSNFQEDSTKCAPQNELNKFITMATYLVPDLPNIKGFSGHLWYSILIFANGASYTRSSNHKNILAWVCGRL